MYDDFKDNFNKKDYDQSDAQHQILQYTSSYEVPFSVSKEEALAQLKAKIADHSYTIEPKDNSMTRKIFWFSSIAAILLLSIGVWMFGHHNPLTNVVADKGKHIEYQLPDGSLVSMNAESKMAFEKSKFNHTRFLSLEGEAFFKVKKGKAFIIHTKYANIKVLGTSFDVLARENSFKVSCVTGKILVYSDNQSLIIFPGESIIVANNKLSKYQDRNINSVINWCTGKFYFENVSLNLVFRELERQFNVNFALPDMENKFFTGEFTNKNLTDALDIVCIPMDLTYTIDGNNKIHIKEKTH
jgi:ferric-dicitrate binding protein FerR (iron transport regulator)